jgi:hypothetical protein
MSYEQARALMDRGVSRPTLFALTLPNLVNRRTNDYLNLFCRATAIPEIRTATAFVNGHERMGISREQPTAIRFGKPFTIEVIENSEFSVYQDLRQWFDMTCVDINNPRASQRMNYYASYVQDMQLHKLELPDNLLGALGSAELTANYKRVMTINFVNAYPINIGAISLNTESRNTVTTYSVDFTYESYSIGDTTGVGGQLF